MIGRSKFVSPSNAYHKCKKFLAHMFGYDAFGNVRSTSGVGADATGGDFRFQGQWLESETGIYHFRARDYDSRTGAFLSRDPVDSTAQDSEALHPYQFAYNSPYVYSDPTGMFTLLELNAGQAIDRALTAGQQYAFNQARQYLLDKAKGVVGNIIQNLLGTLFPFGNASSQLLGVLSESVQTTQGRRYENLLRDNLCDVLGGGFPSYVSRLWIEPLISRFGEPIKDGLGACGALMPARRPPFQVNLRGYRPAKPDFVIKQLGPASFDHARNSQNPKADLIGDVARTLSTVVDKFSDNRRSQIPAIMNYARYGNNHQNQPIALFVTLFGGDQEDLARIVRDGITRYGVVPLVASLLPNRNGR